MHNTVLVIFITLLIFLAMFKLYSMSIYIISYLDRLKEREKKISNKKFFFYNVYNISFLTTYYFFTKYKN